MKTYVISYPSMQLLKRGCEGLAARIAAIYDNLTDKDMRYHGVDEDFDGLLYYLQMMTKAIGGAKECADSKPRKITVYSKFEDLVEALKDASQQPTTPRQ